MVRNDKILDAGEYEVFIMRSLLREKDAQEYLYVDEWYHSYVSSLQEAQIVTPTVASDMLYVITLRISPRNIAINDPDAPPPPDLRADMAILNSQGLEFAGTISAVDPGNIVH